jgi:hypothetical protein
MKIKIEVEGYRFTIPLPIGIIMNGFTARIIESCIKKHVHVPFTGEQLVVVCRAIKQAKKVFPKLPLVQIQTADGQRVLITL